MIELSDHPGRFFQDGFSGTVFPGRLFSTTDRLNVWQVPALSGIGSNRMDIKTSKWISNGSGWISAIGLLFLVAAPAHAEITSPDATAQANAQAAEVNAGAANSGQAQADDGHEWHVDEQNRRYRVLEYPKGIENRHYKWVSEDRVQIQRGLRYDVLDHDDEKFYLKIYERKPTAAPVPKAEPQGPSAEELEAIQRSYDTDVGKADVLKLKPFDRGLPRQGQWRNGFDVADMNGDGHLDIVFGPSRKGSPRPNIFLGNSKGEWQPWRTEFPRFPYDYGDAAVADFNGDGHMDVAFGIHLKGVLVLVGDGQGRFESWSEGIALEIPGQGGDASTFSSRALEVVDWNADGRMDLLALGEGPKGIRVFMREGVMRSANGPIMFLNNGDGSWESKGYETRLFGDSVATGDFNGDGRVDFLAGSNAAGYNQILHLGQGEQDWESVAVDPVREKSFARAVSAADVNGDDRLDILVGYSKPETGRAWRTGVDLLLAKDSDAGAGSWERKPLFAVEERYGVYALDTGDVDGDGHLDIAVATGQGEVELFRGLGDGQFNLEVSPEFPEAAKGCRGYELRLVDLDGDGRDEIIVALAGEPTGTVGIASFPGCPSQGSLRVWTAGKSFEQADM